MAWLPTVEVQWEAETWTDETSHLVRGTVDHGGGDGNPDQPTAGPAFGSLTLEGEPPAGSARYPVRLRDGQLILWAGWLQDFTVEAETRYVRWRLAGDKSDHLSRDTTLSTGAGTLTALLTALSTATGMSTSGANLPTRNVKALSVQDRAGKLLSRAAQLASAELVETKTGTLIVANPHITEQPAVAALVRSPDVTIYQPESRRRTDRIRTRATVIVDSDPTGTARTIPFSATLATTPADRRWPTTWTAQIPLPEGATYSAPTVTATGILHITRNWHRAAVDRSFRAGSAAEIVAPVTATATVNDDSTAATVSISVALPTTPTTISVGYHTGQSLPISSNAFVSWANFFSTSLPSDEVGQTRGQKIEVTGTIRVTQVVGNPPAATLIIDSDAEQLWGQRPLELAPWADDSDATIVTAIIEALAEERKEYSLRIPLQELEAQQRDAGEYITLQVHDPGLKIEVNQVCLITRRRLVFGRQMLAYAQLRCLATPAAGPRPVRGPSTVTATALTTTSIRVDWTDVPANSEPATGWQIETSSNGGTSWARVASEAAARTVTITGLPSSTLINVRARAVTSAGNSSWVTTSATTLTPEAAPGVPQALNGAAAGSTGINIDWNAPNTGGSVTAYRLQWREAGTSSWSRRVGLLGRSAGITGLKPATNYQFRVRAEGPGGNSPYAATITVRTANPAAPGAPTSLAATAGDGELRVTWSDPVTGGPVRDYRIEWATGVSPLGNHTVTSPTYLITGLTNGTEYTIRVRAQNAGGHSAYVEVRATPEEVGLPGIGFVEAGNRILNIYIQLRLAPYTAPPGYTASSSARMEYQTSDGSGGWSGSIALRRHNFNTRYIRWDHATWPKQIRGRILLTETADSSLHWSEWEITTFTASSSAPADRYPVPITVDDRLLIVDEGAVILEEPSNA